MREALQPHELRHADRSVFTDAADVVAPEVDEHHVLGALLFVALELFGQPHVFFVAASARPRPRNRMRLDPRTFDAHEHLRRRADHRHAAHSDEIHVRRRVHVAQRAVNGEWIGGYVGLEPLRQHDLIDVARGDVLLGRAHLLFELLARVIRRDLEAVRRVALGFRQVAFQLALEELNLRARELIQRLEIVVRGDPRIGDDQDPVLHVVEREDGVEQHEPGLIRSVDAGAEIAEHRLEPRGGAVPEIADRAARESRKLGHEGRSEIRHQTAQRVDERAIARARLAATLDGRLPVARAQNQERILAEERIAAHVLAALHALEQERVVRVFGDLQERRHRRQQVCDDLLADRHERAAPRQLLEGLKRRNLHRAQTPPAASARPHASRQSGASCPSTREIARAPARRASPDRQSSDIQLPPPRAAAA